MNDSKKLTAKARERLEIEIKATARRLGRRPSPASRRSPSSTSCTPPAWPCAGRWRRWRSPPAFALVDGNYAFALPCPVKTVVGGDGLSCSIAAASILAKTARDRLMVEMDARYPGYGFAAPQGLSRAGPLAALRRLGPCADPPHGLGAGAAGAGRRAATLAGLSAEALAASEAPSWPSAMTDAASAAPLAPAAAASLRAAAAPAQPDPRQRSLLVVLGVAGRGAPRACRWR